MHSKDDLDPAAPVITRFSQLLESDFASPSQAVRQCAAADLEASGRDPGDVLFLNVLSQALQVSPREIVRLLTQDVNKSRA